MSAWLDRSMLFYLRELNQQAERAVDAFTELGELVRADAPVKPMFVAAQDVLTAAAMISKMLWPIRQKIVLHRERGEALRSLLGVEDSPLLRSREVRDALEHFDERLDRYLHEMHAEGRPWVVVDQHYGATGDIIVAGKPVLVLRLLERDRAVISVLGTEVDLDDLVAEIVGLNDRVISAAMDLSPSEVAGWPRYEVGNEEEPFDDTVNTGAPTPDN